jgi:hypothetical protein
MFRWMLIAGLLVAPAAEAQVATRMRPLDQPRDAAPAQKSADAEELERAQPVGEASKGEPPKRIRSVLLYGEEKCPPATSPDEIVVCANGGDSPYRIPKKLRETEYTPSGVAWGRRAEIVEEVNRAGLPDSCSPIGTGGQTGCTAEMLRAWAAEQAAKKDAQAKIP